LEITWLCKMKMGIIYVATCVPNGKIYIGKTTGKLCKRKSRHLYEAYKSSRDFNSAFHNAIRRYGIDKFNWKIIDKSLFPELLSEMEKYYIKEFDCRSPRGYNLTDGGDGCCGAICSETTKEKLRKINTGKKHSPEVCLKISESNTETYRNGRVAYLKGKKLSDETKLKMSISRSGDKCYWFGKHHSNESKEKMSNAHYGKNCGERHYLFGKHLPEETKKKIGDANRGEKNPNYSKCLSEETKRKMSEARIIYWEVKHAGGL
jgi:group I intron endonuclease